MEFNLLQNIQYCGEIVQEVSNLLNYSHILSSIAVLLIGSFVVLKSQFSLLGKILFAISVFFSIWVISNLSIWNFYYYNSLVMAIWALIEVWAILLFLLFLYFTYVFIEKKDASILLKWIFSAPVFVAAALSVTGGNLTDFDVQECIAVENPFYQKYILAVKLTFSVCLVAFAIYKLIKVNSYFRKQVALLLAGVVIFLLSFLVAGYIAEQTEEFIYEAVGLLGMVAFVGFMGYQIVRFKTFNVKLIGSQALVASIIFLTGAGIFYIQGTTDLVLTLSSFLLIVVAGYKLTQSVRREIEQREKIEKLAVELEQANTQLKELDRQKDELLGLVSHQLATPVSSIKWYLEMLKDGDLGPLNKEQAEHVLAMHGIGESMSDLVSMILDVSRIQLGRMRIEKQDLNLKDFFHELISTITPKAKEKKIQFNVDIPAEFPAAKLDRRYTNMTIENLLSNAVKYTPEGGTVNFTVKLQENRMTVTVADTGMGIPAEEQPKIFGRMFRASNARNAIDGNGFGLYVAKGAVEAQGGKIWFESTEGKGTIFYVELPLDNGGSTK